MSASNNFPAQDEPKSIMQRLLDTVERVGNRVPHPVMIFVYLIVFVVLLSALLSLLGIAGGVWSEKFDHIAAVTNFVVTPLAFLSGTFYTVDRLPEPWHLIALFNPFFYMIDGFRFGFIGHADAHPWTGAVILIATNVALAALCYGMFKRGYKLRS
jgi:ABC-2 type transport system permease protein